MQLCKDFLEWAYNTRCSSHFHVISICRLLFFFPLSAAPEALYHPPAAWQDGEGGDLHATSLPHRQGRRSSMTDSHSFSLFIVNKILLFPHWLFYFTNKCCHPVHSSCCLFFSFFLFFFYLKNKREETTLTLTYVEKYNTTDGITTNNPQQQKCEWDFCNTTPIRETMLINLLYDVWKWIVTG